MDIKNLEFRNEQAFDFRAVEELTRDAFWNHHSPGCDEHYLVHILRDSDALIKELDVVALLDKKIVAHIMYSKANIMGDDNKKHDILSFGPISVLPEYQGRGIGKALIEHTKKLATDLGYKAVLIYGDPDYYSKSGFVAAENFKIASGDNKYCVPLQALELVKGALSDCSGRFIEDSIYEIDAKDAKKFDKSFPPKELKENLPSQKRFSELIKMNRPR